MVHGESFCPKAFVESLSDISPAQKAAFELVLSAEIGRPGFHEASFYSQQLRDRLEEDANRVARMLDKRDSEEAKQKSWTICKVVNYYAFAMMLNDVYDHDILCIATDDAAKEKLLDILSNHKSAVVKANAHVASRAMRFFAQRKDPMLSPIVFEKLVDKEIISNQHERRLACELCPRDSLDMFLEFLSDGGKWPKCMFIPEIKVSKIYHFSHYYKEDKTKRPNLAQTLLSSFTFMAACRDNKDKKFHEEVMWYLLQDLEKADLSEADLPNLIPHNAPPLLTVRVYEILKPWAEKRGLLSAVEYALTEALSSRC